MNKQIRLFFALWPDDMTRSALARLQFDLSGSKTRYRNFHITLAFLGEQDSTVLPVLEDVLASLDAPSMHLSLDRRGHFSRQKIAWAGMTQSNANLEKLQKDIVQALRDKNISFADNAIFKPHVTLARDNAAPPEQDFPPIAWHAKQVALVQSLDTPDGLQYDVLASHWLKRNP